MLGGVSLISLGQVIDPELGLIMDELEQEYMMGLILDLPTQGSRPRVMLEFSYLG